MERKAVKEYLGLLSQERRIRKEDQIVTAALRSLDPEKLDSMGLDLKSLVSSDMSTATDNTSTSTAAPLCDRCHNLIHHSKGVPILHPTVDSLRETIEESPHKYNHVYHVLDAADFPMSLLPRIHQLLDLMPLRSQNRRSRHTGRFYGGRKMEMSFVITRADLLAPKKEQVDRLMPYLTEILRDRLGRSGKAVRLGNVHCVSAMRGWWTRKLKEEVWERGGAGWMVGKVNVGKSQLFETIFPKGRMDSSTKQQISVPVFARGSEPADGDAEPDIPQLIEPAVLGESSLLPPAQLESNFPAMPVVSSLPGTTASPIRVPFGSGKGELIDLPGLARSDLEEHVKSEHRGSLLMTSRVTPEQQVLKPGQSLLIGGLIRITPRTPDLIFLAYAFTPIKPHLTSTTKAVAIQEQNEDAPEVDTIALPGTGDKIRHAGSFSLKYDVTKQRTGPITRRNAANISVERLPYRVLALDVLIEGCGWVEVVAQVRTRHLFGERTVDEFDAVLGAQEEPREPNWPVIDVYSPEGKFIATRMPMNAWMLNKPLNKATKSRPRRSMKGAKKRDKMSRREASAEP
jgi:hypothetical protein